MTTIAYKDGIVAADSQATDSDGIITDHDYNKMWQRDGIKFWCAGDIDTIGKLIELWPEGKFDTKDEVDALVLDGNILYTAGFEGGQVWKNLMNPERTYAIGSGAHLAYGAMDAGLSAREAVKIAIGRDTNSGGKIRVFNLTKLLGL